MKIKIVAAFAGLLFLISGSPAFTAETNSVTADWKDLVTRINTKIRAEQKTEKDLADELKEFDALLVKHKGADAEDLAQILSLKAGLSPVGRGLAGKARLSPNQSWPAHGRNSRKNCGANVSINQKSL